LFIPFHGKEESVSVLSILKDRFDIDEKLAKRIASKMVRSPERIEYRFKPCQRTSGVIDWLREVLSEENYRRINDILGKRYRYLVPFPDHNSVLSNFLYNYIVDSGNLVKANWSSVPAEAKDIPGFRYKDQLPSNPAQAMDRIVAAMGGTGKFFEDLNEEWHFSREHIKDQHLRVLNKTLVLTNSPTQKLGMSENGIKSCMSIIDDDDDYHCGPVEAALCNGIWIAYLTNGTKDSDGFEKKFWRALVVNGKSAISVLKNYPFYSDTATKEALRLMTEKRKWGDECLVLESKSHDCIPLFHASRNSEDYGLYFDPSVMVAMNPEAFCVKVPNWSSI